MRGDGVRKRRGRKGWWISWTDNVGRHQVKSKYSDFEMARHELEQYRAKARAAKETGYLPASFKEAAKEYLDRQKSLVTPKEYQRQTLIMEAHLKPFFRGKLSDISRRNVERYVMTRSRQCSPGTVRKEFGVLRHLLNWLLDNGMVPANPAVRIKLPNLPPGRLRYLQPGEFQTLLESLPPWIKPIVALAAWTGMRRSEILGLRWLDVDLANRVINLPQSKNGKGRTVYLNESAMNVFRSLPLNIDSEPTEPVLALETTPEELSMCFMRACRTLGIQDFRFHDLRHTHASWLRQKGVQLDEIAKQLGHADLRMTMRYSHLGQAQVREAVDRLDSILSSPKATEAETRRKEKSLSLLN